MEKVRLVLCNLLTCLLSLLNGRVMDVVKAALLVPGGASNSDRADLFKKAQDEIFRYVVRQSPVVRKYRRLQFLLL